MADDKVQLNSSAPIDFGRRLADSEVFWKLFNEGMSLVEETASYLDEPGKLESRQLSRTTSILFGTESMRLTTRLMQLASWLLLQRAINDGSMSTQRAESERSKVKLGVLATATEGPGWDGLPLALRRLILRSLDLQTRVMTLDRGLHEGAGAEGSDNPVGRAIDRISDAFGSKP